ncbi:dehydrogenase [Aureimonas altamirensis]|uniref:Dehydrogenase n=1 Tax=Aureimonas altamirensis TaxID=370622 RepID=A0A0B1Q8F4_9HYPH|nr:Ldh family oxidoreductase [Aureimonas altamirensis]KHJ55217.1 dehydrogenase [Aureimonas altamirensis]
MIISPDQLRDLAATSLKRHGAPQDNASLQADLLIEAELRGLPSHGVQRLPRLLSRIDRGLADPQTTGIGVWSRQGFLSVDGKRGLGPVVMMAAMRELEGALAAGGVAIAAIRNANHIGMLAYYVEAAAQAGSIGIVMSSSEALVHPYGGTQAMLGTNPLAAGIPTAGEPFILDLATSVVSMGKIHNHALRGTAIPSEWAVDAQGRPTTDPEAAKAGAIAPFGGAKGYGLGLMIELLVAALAGSHTAPDVRGTLDDIHPANKGDILILVDPAAGGGSASALTAYLDSLRASRPADPAQPVVIPGDGSRKRRTETAARGIDVPDELLQTLSALATT